MRLAAIIIVSILLVGGVGWAVFDPDGFRHKFVGYSKAERERAEMEYQTAILNSQSQLDAELLETRVKLAELRFGTAFASKYRLCREVPPKTKEHQLECKRLEARMVEADGRDEKHPW